MNLKSKINDDGFQKIFRPPIPMDTSVSQSK